MQFIITALDATDENALDRRMALEGAIRGIKKTILDEEVKADLKEFYQWKKK